MNQNLRNVKYNMHVCFESEFCTDSRSLGRVVGEEAVEEVDELRGEEILLRLVLRVGLPEGGVLVEDQASVVGTGLGISLGEGRVSSNLLR